MNTVRINISLPKETFQELTREVEPRKRSRFITEATKRLLKERQAQRLAREYQEEIGEAVFIEKPLWCLESFFQFSNEDFHEISFIYEVHLKRENINYKLNGC